MTTPRKNPAAVALGRLGGAAGKGKAKARTSEQARAAAMARWGKRKAHGTIDQKALAASSVTSSR